MIFWNLIKSNNESWWEIREINIFKKKTWKRIHILKKSMNLDQDSRRNHQVNKREFSKIKNHEKQKLKFKLTKIKIQN